MTSDREHAKNVALGQTVLACLVLEGLAVLVLSQFSGSLLEAALRSMFVLGPVTPWIARPLYRDLRRANR
jgi:hypothetical protein